MNDFEEQLKSQPFRPIPPQWRQEILQAAQAEVEPNVTKPAAAHFVRSWWRELLWPCPQAWAALAGIWMVLFWVSFRIGEPVVPKSANMRPLVIPPQILMALQEQHRFYLELIQPAPVQEAETKPRPRTGIKLEFMCV